MNRRLALPTLIVAASLAGCALESPPKPDEIRAQSLPNVAIPPAYTAMGGVPVAVIDGWLARFADPQLDAEVSQRILAPSGFNHRTAPDGYRPRQ